MKSKGTCLRLSNLPRALYITILRRKQVQIQHLSLAWFLFLPISRPPLVRIDMPPSAAYIDQPISRPFPRPSLGAILQQAHPSHVVIVRVRFARSIQSVQRAWRVRRRLAFQCWCTVIRDSCGQGSGIACIGFATGEGDVFMA